MSGTSQSRADGWRWAAVLMMVVLVLPRRTAVAVALLAVSLVPPAGPARAAEIVVTTTSSTGPGCNLTDALRAANTRTRVGGCVAGAGAIVLQPGATYTLTAPADTDPLFGPTGMAVVTGQVTIQGNGATIERSSAAGTPPFRIFRVTSGSLLLDRVTLQGGNSSFGGGIYVEGGTLTLTHSSVRSNTAEFNGGGIYGGGSIAITDSSVTGNTSTRGAGGLRVGGGPGSTVTVLRSAITNNTSGNIGGITIADGTTTIANSTISGNTATSTTSFTVGGLDVDGNLPVTLINTTVVNNRATGTSGAGGVFSEESNLILKNTIVAGNLMSGNASHERANCGQEGTPIVSSGNNLFGTGTGCPAGGPGDVVVTPGNVLTSVLGPLQDNGGPTQTHALLNGSPALNAGDNAACAAAPIQNVDQRGNPRPQGGHCDIGAVEGVGSLATPTPTPTGTVTRTPTLTPTPGPSADLSLTLQASSLAPAPNAQVTLTVMVANAGPNTATGIAVRLVLPAGLSYGSDNGGGSFNSGTGIWTVGAISVGGSASLQVTSTFTASSPISVTAQVSASSLPDPDSTPNNNVPEDDQQAIQLSPLGGDIIVNDASAAVNPADGMCTLIEAIIAANTDAPSGSGVGECTAGDGADTIRLQAVNPPYVLSTVQNTASLSGNPAGANGLPVITSDITIVGGGATIERAAGPATPDFRLFAVDGGGKLTLRETTVRNGRASGPGGGIIERAGGAVLSLGALELVNSVIADSVAGCDGGGIAAYFGPLTLRSGSIVRDNSTSCSGGGIFARSMASMQVNDTTVRRNTAGTGGGLVLFEGITATLTDTVVEENTAASEGGGLLAHGVGAQVTLNKTLVRNNRVTAGHGGGIANGRLLNGAFLVSGGPMTLIGSTISGNTATGGHGGGIVNLGPLTATASSISDNTATTNGGGISVVGPATTMTLDDTTVQNNRVTAGNGGGIANGGLGAFAGGTVTLRNSRVLGNNVTANVVDGIGGGGGIYTRGPLVDLVSSVVQSNTVDAPPGFMFTDGGGLLVDHSPGPIEVRATDSVFRLNRVSGPSPEGGGLFIGLQGTLLLTRTVVEQNEAIGGGGVMVMGRATISDSTIRSNVATQGGGVRLLNVGNLPDQVTLDRSTVSANRATGPNGICGGIDNEGFLTLRSSSVVEYNEASSAVQSGGGICNIRLGGYEAFTGQLTILDSTVRGNRAPTGTGGGIYNDRGRVNLTRSTLSSNSSSTFAALISTGNGATVTMLGSTVRDNTSVLGVFGAGAGTATTITNSTISANITQGAIFNSNGAMTFTNGTIAANSAARVLEQSGTLTLANTIVAGNTRPGLGTPSVECSSFGGTITSAGYNLVGQGTGCPTNGPGDITVDPASVFASVLGPLAENGGATRTHRPLPGSPAIDAGNPSPPGPGNPFPCPFEDQRQFSRPWDGDGIGGDRCDIGSYERRVPPDNVTPTLSSLQPASGLAGGPGLSLVVTGTNFVESSIVLWNGIPLSAVRNSPTQFTATVTPADLTLATEIGTVLVTVLSLESSMSNALPFTIVSPRIQGVQSGVVPPGATGAAVTLPTTAGAGGVGATLTNNGATGDAAVVSVASYATNPTTGTVLAAGGFFDVQVANVDPTDSLDARFYYPSTVTGAAESALQLSYWTGSTWAPVRGSQGIAPLKDTTDNLDASVSGGRFTTTFDNTSTPRLIELSGTVFSMATTDALPPTPTPGPTGSPTPSPTSSPNPTATPTPAPIGGRGFTLRAGSPVELSWQEGLQQTAYLVLRWSPLSGVALLPSPDPAQALPGTAGSYADTSSVGDGTYCYGLFPVGGTPPTTNSVLGISDLLCIFQGSGSGVTPGNIAARLDGGTTATLSWSPFVIPARYELVATRLDGSPPRQIPLPGGATSYADDTSGQTTCYHIVASMGSIELGRTDRVCVAPGVGNLAGSGSPASFRGQGLPLR